MEAEDLKRSLAESGISTPNHLTGSHSLSQPCNAGYFESLATASAHAKSTPAAAPVLIFIVSMADCALDGSVLIA